jgi:hypothetical protein
MGPTDFPLQWPSILQIHNAYALENVKVMISAQKNLNPDMTKDCTTTILLSYTKNTMYSLHQFNILLPKLI